MTEHNIERLLVWRVLSELFLDTEITDEVHQSIARALNKSALSTEMIGQILWYEMFPVLSKNLDAVAGVWDGWSDEWLLSHLSVQPHTGLIKGKRSHIKAIEAEWAAVCIYLNNLRKVS